MSNEMEMIEVNFKGKKKKKRTWVDAISEGDFNEMEALRDRTIKITIPKCDIPPIVFQASNEIPKAESVPDEMKEFIHQTLGFETREVKVKRQPGVALDTRNGKLGKLKGED